MRRFISVLLALVVCFSLACTVSAATGSTPNNAPINMGAHTQGSTGNMTVTIKDATQDNTTIKDSNGKVLGSGNYTVKNGVITFNQSYLNTLSAGKYSMYVTVDGVTYEVQFVVNAAGVLSFLTNPKTGDMARMDLWVPMMAVSALALAVVIFFYFKKFRKVN